VYASGMGTLVDFDNPRCEALPTPSGRRRVLRSTLGEPPGGDEEFFAALPHARPQGQSRLPRVLVGVRVLVVDDDPDTTDLFAAALAACGADVVTATSAPEALRALAARAPDVVVTDIAMPGADGYWLLHEIRQLPDARTRTVPVLAVTAFGREHSRARVLTAGFVDRLAKPVDPEELCRAVARARGR
jgi:CheY-like chemotaxis protein